MFIDYKISRRGDANVANNRNVNGQRNGKKKKKKRNIMKLMIKIDACSNLN